MKIVPDRLNTPMDLLAPLNISIVIIGLNVERVLPDCIKSVNRALSECRAISNCEILYVDSGSTDATLQLLPKSVRVFRHLKGPRSAAFGRFVGMKHSIYDNVLFLDADMVLDCDWFSAAYSTFIRHHGVVGRRTEVRFNEKSKRFELENPNYYNYHRISVVKRFGGFLMINKAAIKGVNYNPFFKSEEEAAFYQKFSKTCPVYSIPNSGFIHRNMKLKGRNTLHTLSPERQCDYWGAFFLAIRDRQIGEFITTHFDQYLAILFLTISVILGVALGPVSITPILLVLSLCVAVARRKKSAVGQMLLAPSKLVYFLIFRFLPTTIVYDGERKKYMIKGTFWRYKHCMVRLPMGHLRT